MLQPLSQIWVVAKQQRECTLGSEEKQPKEHKTETQIWLIWSTEKEKMIA